MIKKEDINNKLLEKVLKQELIDAGLFPEVREFKIDNDQIFINKFYLGDNIWNFSIDYKEFDKLYKKLS